MTWCRSLCRRATLAAANALFFGGAIWLLTAGARVRKAGWLDIFEDEYPWFHTLYVLVVVLLSLLIATLAISGLYSVLFKRRRWVLLVYAATSLLTLAVCAFLVIEGGISLSTAHAWKAHAAIDPPTEARVEANFNTVYCLSQAAFVCTAAANAQWLVHFGSEDLRDLYLDARVAAQVKQAMAAERYGAAHSLLALCEDEASPLHSAGLSESVAQLCTWCGDIADLQSYVHLVSWANSKCPPSRPSALYCVQNVWLNYSNPESTAPPLESPIGVFATGTTPATGQQSSSSSGGGGGGGYSDPSGRQPYASGGGGGYSDPNRWASNPSTGGVAASVMPDPPYALCRKTFLSYWSYLSLWLLLLSLAMLVFMTVTIRVAWVTLRAKPDRYSQRHGRKPERRPLVQLASKPPALASANSNPATARRAPTSTTAKKGALAKAKALFSKGKK